MAWKGKTEEIQCSLVEGKKVILSLRVQNKVKLLMNEYKHQEWLGYLVGKVNKQSIQVQDLVIPPHRVATGASAEAEEGHWPDKCIGILHSHHTMGAFHSGVDQNHVDANYPVSITVANRAGTVEYDAVAKCTTICGKQTTIKVRVYLDMPKLDFDAKQFLQEAIENIEKAKQSVIVYGIEGNTDFRQIALDYKAGKISVQDYLDKRNKASKEELFSLFDIYGNI